MTTIQAPRSPARPRQKGVNWEKWGWIYMRASGVLLLVLIFGHLFVNLVMGEGIKQVDFGFVAGKWASPFWQVWDTLMLWLALIHGTNGMRTLANDYLHVPLTNRVVKVALVVVCALLILLGTLVIYTFDPCPADAPARLLPSFCATR